MRLQYLHRCASYLKKLETPSSTADGVVSTIRDNALCIPHLVFGTGISGTIITACVAEQMGILAAIIRRPTAPESHSDRLVELLFEGMEKELPPSVEFDGVKTHTLNAVFVDDLISTGTTFRTCCDALNRALGRWNTETADDYQLRVRVIGAALYAYCDHKWVAEIDCPSRMNLTNIV